MLIIQWTAFNHSVLIREVAHFREYAITGVASFQSLIRWSCIEVNYIRTLMAKMKCEIGLSSSTNPLYTLLSTQYE